MTDAGTDAGSVWSDDERIGRILAIIAKETTVDLEKLRPDARIEDLGIASLDVVQSIFEIETQFDIEIPPIASNAGAEFATVGDLVSHVLSTLDRQTDHAPGDHRPAFAIRGERV